MPTVVVIRAIITVEVIGTSSGSGKREGLGSISLSEHGALGSEKQALFGGNRGQLLPEGQEGGG